MAKGLHPANNNNSTDQVNINSMARSGLSLPLNQMAIPIYTAPPPSREDVQVGGRVIFQNFIHEELENEGVENDPFEALQNDLYEAGDSSASTFSQAGPSRQHAAAYTRPLSPAMASTPEGYKNAHFAQIGSAVREYANQFAASHERRLIRQEADKVDLGHINRESFFSLMEEVFRNGVNRHCVVALFFFCSDVLIRCLKNNLGSLGAELFRWSLQFIVDRVCQWVYENGGWEKVFSNIWKVAIRVATITSLVVIIGCGLIYMRKNWK